MGKVVSISVTAGGTASDTPIGANDHKNMFNSAHTAYTNYSGGASYGGKNVAGLTVKTRGTMGVVQSFKRTSGALNITGTNNAVNMNKGQFGGNRPNVRPEGGTGTGLVVTTTGTMGVPVALEVSKEGRATNLSAGQAGNNAINSAKKATDLVKAGSASATEYGYGGAGTGLKINTNPSITNEMNTVTKLEVTTVSVNNATTTTNIALSAHKSSGNANATYTGYTGSGSNLTFQTRGTIGALKSITLNKEGSAAASNTLYTVPGVGVNGQIRWAAIDGVPTAVRIKPTAVSRGDLTMFPAAGIQTKATAGHAAGHASFRLQAATYRANVVKTFSLIGAGDGAGATVATASSLVGHTTTHARFTTTVRAGVPKMVRYTNRGTTATESAIPITTTVAPVGGTGAKLASIATQANVVTTFSNSELVTTTQTHFPTSTNSRQTTRVGGGKDINVQYDVEVGEISAATAIATHAAQDDLENTTNKAIAHIYRLTGAGSGYTANTPVTLTDASSNTIKIEPTQVSGGGAIERFRILEGVSVVVPVAASYTDGTATIVVLDPTNTTLRGAVVPTVTSTRTDGVITGVTSIVQAGTNYVSLNNMKLTRLDASGNTFNGSGATFAVSGFLRVKSSGFNTNGEFQIVCDGSSLPNNIQTALTGTNYTYYQVQPQLYSRSAYSNMYSTNNTGLSIAKYTGLSIARRTIYMDGNSNRATAKNGALLLPNDSSDSNAFTVATTDASNTTSVQPPTITNIKIWEASGDASTSNNELTFTPMLDGGKIQFKMRHTTGNIHDVSAVQFTVTLTQAKDAMHSVDPIVETFDVFLHTVRSPFLRA